VGIGEEVRYEHLGRLRRGRLLCVSLGEGLLVDDPDEGRVWRRSEHVRDLRPGP
jgi:hypothetical protein